VSYETLSVLKSTLQPPITTTEKDSTLQHLLDVATEAIDEYCGRTFDMVDEVRTFEAPYDSDLEVTDLLEVTGITVGGTALAATGYQLRPLTLTTRYPHYTRIVRLQAGYPGPWAYRAVTMAIDGTWGYSWDVPATIKEVCRIMATRLYRREITGYANEAGSNEAGATIVQSPKASLDQDCKDMLEPYRRKWTAGTLSAAPPRPWIDAGWP